MEQYLSGKRLYGDDMNSEQVSAWFRDEADGYYNLTLTYDSYTYTYHALNEFHAFRHLPDRRFERVLGFGSARGDELLPIQHRIRHVTLVDPAERFGSSLAVPVSHVKPVADGSLPFMSGSFDLATCFGVLHHIPNVTRVMGELFRCLTPGGYLTVREPMHSMGDWRHPRSGLTKRERGIPSAILHRIVQNCGFRIVHESRCSFSLTSRLRYLLRKPPYNDRLVVRVDAALCKLPFWPNTYNATNPLQKFRPHEIALVLQRP